MNEPMTNPNPLISLQDVSKIYRLYQKPLFRVLDLFGLCPPGPAYYSEHAALKNISLTIGRGEKVAFIGRNGAGKSTLLKIITQTVAPTSGAVAISGSVSALLQIGTGFHGDFSGRQNIFSSLAHMGVTGKEAARKFEEIVDFAELQEYIDQPMKTYSTGMGARLMFASATSIEPDVLVVDELLGVGDAYFAHKSFERMRQMCSNHGTTLLLVTHDIYSALNMCERFFWIDRGEIKMEGNGKATINAYEASIKQQEEDRLRKRNRSTLVKKDEGKKTEAFSGLHVKISSRSGFALPSPLALARLEFRYRDGATLALNVAEGSPSWTLLPESNLGPITTVEGKACRCLSVFGSIYHKAEWSVSLAKCEGLKDLSLSWQYDGAETADIQVLTDDGQTILQDMLPAGGKVWQQKTFELQAPAAGKTSHVVKGNYGTGLIRITSVKFMDRNGNDVVRIKHGEKLTIRTQFTLHGQIVPRTPTFVIAFHKSGMAMGGYIQTDRLELPEGSEFVLDTVLDPLLFGSGQWMVTLGFAEADYYKQPYNEYFTVNNKWYHMIVRGFDLQIDSSCSVDAGAFVMHPAELKLAATLAERSHNAHLVALEART